MPTYLDVPGAARAKVMISPPRLNLRRAASYNGSQNHDKMPLSATSSRFSFNHLLFSPPSPGLPALVPRPRKSPAAPRPSRVLRLLAWAIGLVFFLYVARLLVRNRDEIPVVRWAVDRKEHEYEMVGQDDLPDFPTPIAVTDRRGRSRWTVSIPPTNEFPLAVKDYSDMCAKCQEVAAVVRGKGSYTYPSQHARLDYYYQDPYFVDVSEAETRGLLPQVDVSSKAAPAHLVGVSKESLAHQDVCQKSLTFVLESPEAGVGTTLMMLWMAYGLAQKEKRAFFIDDSRWAYGDYTTMFKAPPVPECSPPPRHEMLPCPHNARHLVASVATASETFGSRFVSEYEHERERDVYRERPMYELARIGYESLFRLNDEDADYVTNRIQELRLKTRVGENNNMDGTLIGLHVRHGDVHPFEVQYSSAYHPLSLFPQKAEEILGSYHNRSMPGGGEDVVAKRHSFMVLASDDPDVYEAEELAGALRAQEQIRLASSRDIKQANPDRNAMQKYVDETFGWEGGFFASMFWNLGRSTADAAKTRDLAAAGLDVPPEMMRLRGFMGRAYAMDLAVLGRGTDVVVCTVSTMGCRLLGVIMGWEKAMERGRWVNIDGDYHWAALSL